MSKKLYLPLVLLMLISMLLSACGSPAPAEPVVEEAPPAATEEVVVEEPALDLDAALASFWASVPADKAYGSVKAASLNEELADKPPFLVDVRETAEIESAGYIEGAVHLPIRELLQNLDKLPGLDEPIVIYCASGHRGAFGMMALKMLGYTDVRNLGGGFGAWAKAELPSVQGAPAAPEAISTAIVADEALFTVLNDFLANLPEGFYGVKADALNAELAEADAPAPIDVRSQAEWDKDGYIEGATLVEFPAFLDSMDKLPVDKDAKIVVYCGSGHRGAMAEMAMYLMGYTNVRNLGGGLGAWKAGGFPVAGVVDWPTIFGEFVASLNGDNHYYSITSASLNEMLAGAPPFLLDVRETSEIEANGYIEGSVNIPIRDLLKNLDKLPAQDQKIVIYCASGHRGALGMTALRMLGYTDVENLGGGMGGWLKAELPAVTGSLPEAPVAGAAPEVDAARLAALDAYLGGLPEGFYSVKAADLNAELATDVKPTIVDVRSAEETSADGYIEGALLLPIGDLSASLDQLPADKAAPVVTVCKSGHRGAIAMMYLQFLGYTGVRNLGGGFGAWVAAELPVVK